MNGHFLFVEREKWPFGPSEKVIFDQFSNKHVQKCCIFEDYIAFSGSRGPIRVYNPIGMAKSIGFHKIL